MIALLLLLQVATLGWYPVPAPAAMAGVVVDAQAPTYRRADWPHWVDADRDCQDTRQEVLIAQSLVPVTLDRRGCRVVAGLWRDPYTGERFTVPAALDIDHIVPLANAFRSGGWSWDRHTRRRYANDLAGLVVASAASNRAKGDKGPEAWRPAHPSAWCAYADRWRAVKRTWGLLLTMAEIDALARMSATCASGKASTDVPAVTPWCLARVCR
jgi:hypothetical protein